MVGQYFLLLFQGSETVNFIVIPETTNERSKEAILAHDIEWLANNYSCPRTAGGFMHVCEQPKQRLNGTWVEMLWMKCFSNLKVHLNHLESCKMLRVSKYCLSIKNKENFLSVHGEFGIREILNSSHLAKSFIPSLILVPNARYLLDAVGLKKSQGSWGNMVNSRNGKMPSPYEVC